MSSSCKCFPFFFLAPSTSNCLTKLYMVKLLNTMEISWFFSEIFYARKQQKMKKMFQFLICTRINNSTKLKWMIVHVSVRSPLFNTITQNSLLKVALNTIILQYSLLYIDMNEILSKIGIIKELFITGQKSQETEN